MAAGLQGGKTVRGRAPGWSRERGTARMVAEEEAQGWFGFVREVGGERAGRVQLFSGFAVCDVGF